MCCKVPKQWFPILTAFVLPLVSLNVFFEPYDTAKWLVLYCFSLVAGSILFLAGRPVRIPKRRVLWGLVIALFILMVLQSWFLDLPFGGKSLNDRLLFVLIFVLAFNSTRKFRSELYPVLAALAPAVAGFSLWQLFSETDPKKFSFVPFFGNINMGAQFVGICILFLAVQLRKGLSRWWVEGALVVGFVFAYFSGCRSVLLALLVACPLILFRQRTDWKALLRTMVLTVAVVLGCRALFSPPEMSRQQLTGTDNSASYRLVLWKSALDMVKDHPFGVGPGEFTFSVMSYKVRNGQWAAQEEVDRYPHNEYVRFLSEDGVLTSVLIFFLIALVLREVGKLSRGPEKNIFAGLCAYLAVEAFFQFPLENAFPFFVTAWMTGSVFRRNAAPGIIVPKALGVVPLVMIAALSTAVILAEYWVRNDSQNLKKSEWACRLAPANWRSCMFYANNLINAYELSAADRVLDPILERQPYHFPALRLSAQTAFRRNDWERGCLRLKTYEEAFGGQSPLHDFFQEKCKFLK